MSSVLSATETIYTAEDGAVVEVWCKGQRGAAIVWGRNFLALSERLQRAGFIWHSTVVANYDGKATLPGTGWVPWYSDDRELPGAWSNGPHVARTERLFDGC